MTDTVLLDHGSGGKRAHRLIVETLLPVFTDPALAALDDGALIEMGGCRLAFSTDTYVVDPLFFPGGDIGELAVNGTVNDLAMCGAEPAVISVAMVIEEGLPMADLQTVIRSMALAAEKAGVRIVTGDTKVVPRGAADKLFINTAGIGRVPDGIAVSGRLARPGDQVILSGTMADHGITIMAHREGLRFDAPIRSDTAPLNHLVKALLDRHGADIHVLRDPTRGGVGTTLNEIALASHVGICIHEERLPVNPAVKGICDMLGFDPLYVANEGKCLVVAAAEAVDSALALIQSSEYGRDAAVIGEVTAERPGTVFMKTRIGGTRIVDMLTGEQLPRIC